MVSELEEAIKEFKSNYSQFLKKNQKYTPVDDELEIDFLEGTTLVGTATAFGDRIRKIQNVTERKDIVMEKKWTRQVEQFLIKLYPVARFACGFAAVAAEVLPPNFGFLTIQAAPLIPLKGIATGLGLIFQILEDEAGRAEDFRSQLRVIEFQVALIADNPNYDLRLETTQKLLENASTQLLTAIVQFFNSALLYLGSGFFRVAGLFLL